MRLALLSAAMLLSVPGALLAQSNPAPAPASVDPKPAACRESGLQKQLRGPDLVDHVAICLAEARLACTKQAVEQKIRGLDRREFLKRCPAS